MTDPTLMNLPAHASPTDWLLLAALVAATLFPVILLWGYAGCNWVFGLDETRVVPSVPVNLQGRPTAIDTVELTWEYNSSYPATFELERIKEGEIIPVFLTTPALSFIDNGLEEGATYFYRVRAVETAPEGLTSDWSIQITVMVLPFQQCFGASLDISQAGLEGYCFVQRIEPPRLFLGGNVVRIILRGATSGPLGLDRIYISQPSATGEPYDSAPDLTLVAQSVTVPADDGVSEGRLVLPLVNYALDRTRPLLIIFDISAQPGMGNVRYTTTVATTEAGMYFRAATAEAALQDRGPSVMNPGSAPYTLITRMYLVEKIEVA